MRRHGVHPSHRPTARPVDDSIYLVIAVTFVGFIAVAFLLLFPVYRFLNREERASREWTDDAIARRQRRPPPDGDGPAGNGPTGDGAATPPPPPPRAAP